MVIGIRNAIQPLFAAVLIAPAICSGQAGDASSSDSSAARRWFRRVGADLASDALSTLHNGAHYLTAPGRCTADEWAATVFAAGTIALSAMLDEPVRDAVQARRTPAQDRLIDPFAAWGSGAVSTSLAGGIYLCGLGFGNEWIRETGRAALASLALACSVTGILKIGVGRARPYLDEGAWRFKSFESDGAHISFPSGHTTAAFALSSALACRMRNGWVTAGFFVLATAVAAQRIHDDQHWLSDTVAGAIVGTAAGVFVVHDSRPTGHPGKISLVPVITGSGQGCAVAVAL